MKTEQKVINGDIYLITNLINGKLYVGQSRCPNGGYIGRWKDHIYVAEREEIPRWYIDRAIKKYGKENFKIELLERSEFNDIDSCVDWMDNRESFYISKLNTRANGYNLTDGGKGNRGRKISEYQKIKFLERVSGYSRLGEKISDESKDRISKALKKFYSNDKNKEIALQKRKLTMSKRVYESHNKKPVLQYSSAGVFIKEYDSIISASRYTNISESKISLSCRHDKWKANGFIFKYRSNFEFNIPAKIDSVQFYGARAKQVDQISLDGYFIKSYPSAVEAGKSVGVKGKKISACISGDYKTYKGYIWKFSNR